MKMIFKKQTKHTVVYEVSDKTEDLLAVVPIRSVYVDKIWLASQDYKEMTPSQFVESWPAAIELEVRL